MNGADILWTSFEAAIEKHTEAGLAVFRPPASNSQIAAAERALGLTFPEQLRYAYRRHDGVAPKHEPGPLRFDLFCSAWWCSLDELVETWRFQAEARDRLVAGDFDAVPAFNDRWAKLEIRPEWFNRLWIPIGIDNMPAYYIDMAPGPSGRIGQLVAISEMGGAEGVVIAPSLFDWVLFVTRALESGRFHKGPSGYWDDRDKNYFRYEPPK